MASLDNFFMFIAISVNYYVYIIYIILYIMYYIKLSILKEINLH